MQYPLLSDLIEEGSKLHVQGFYNIVNRMLNEDGTALIRTCAMGAAIEKARPDMIELYLTPGTMLTKDNGIRNVLQLILGYDTYVEQIENPISQKQEAIYDVVAYLNDVEGWTREDIASWLRDNGR
jgi:hypothetical protein